MDALSQTLRGTERGVRVNRRDAAGQVQVLQPGLNDKLQPNDIVYIKESSDLMRQVGHGILNLEFTSSYDGEFREIKEALIYTADTLSRILHEFNKVSNTVAASAASSVIARPSRPGETRGMPPGRPTRVVPGGSKG